MDFFTLTDHDTMKGVHALARNSSAIWQRPPIPLIPV